MRRIFKIKIMFRKFRFKKITRKKTMWLALICASFYFISQTNCSQAAGPTEVIRPITSPTVWIKENSPYIIKYSIYADAELTIEPGTIIKFNRGAMLNIDERLNAAGTEDEKIIFTSIKDDSAGGDTNKDGTATSPARGDWTSIFFYKGEQSIMEHVVVSYGSVEGAVMGAVTINLKDIIIRNSEINNSGYSGIFIKDSQPTIENNIISNNRAGVLSWSSKTPKITNNSIVDNDIGASVILSLSNRLDAADNWWGHDSGPYHAVLNPTGQGNRVSDGVIFDPWTGKKDEEIDPVIIVPGIMGSWEKYGEWVIDPVLHTYDNLIEAMVSSGYELNETLFLLPYDWRQSNTETADLLKQKILEIKDKTGKVDIVAHSMGGLAARYYIQSNAEHYVDQLIFLGTPHQGSPKDYLAYEGGYIPGRLGGIMKFIFQIEAIESGYFSLPQYIREQIPSVEQLLPVYDYLQEEINNEWQFRLYPIQYPRNTFLENLNVEPAIEILKQRVNITNVYSSAGANSTLSAIKVIPDPNIYDSKWMDGYPINLEEGDLSCLIPGNGDGTVPTESLSFLSGVDTVEFADADHSGIVTEAQNDIIEILTGTRPDDYYSGPWATIKKILFIRVYSPVDFVVIAPDGSMVGKDFSADTEINQIAGAFYSGFNSDVEFAAIINPVEGDYQVKLQGTDDGTYQLGIDILEDESTGEQEEDLISGIISDGAEEIFYFNYSESAPELEIEKEINFNTLIQDLNELYAGGEISKQNVQNFLDNKFRHLSENYDKIEEEERVSRIEKLKEQIINSFEQILEKLDFYLKKAWISQIAYNVLSKDIINLINKLN